MYIFATQDEIYENLQYFDPSTIVAGYRQKKALYGHLLHQ